MRKRKSRERERKKTNACSVKIIVMKRKRWKGYPRPTSSALARWRCFCVCVSVCVCCVLLLLQLCIACQCTCATNHFCPESPRQRVEVFLVLFAGLHYRLRPLHSLPPLPLSSDPPATLPSTCFQVSFASLATFCVLLRFLFCSRFRGRLI